MSNLNRPNLPAGDVRKVLAARNLEVTARRRVVLLGVRGYFRDSQGVPGVNDRNIYDDALFVCLPDRVVSFNGNTDPSAWRTGIATLKPGEWRFIAGMHGISRPSGGYPAFRQHGPFQVTRDNVGSEVGEFAINLHRGGETGTSSLGCQTVPPSQWMEFRNLLYRTLGTNEDEVRKSPAGVRNRDFTYLLIDRSELERIIGRSL